MTTGKEIKVYIDDVCIALQTSCSVSISQSADPIEEIPGSPNDDGWQHYKGGVRSWSIDVDYLYMLENDVDVLNKIMQGDSDVQVEVTTEGDYVLRGDAIMTEVSIMADNNALMKCTAKLIGKGFPEIIEE